MYKIKEKEIALIKAEKLADFFNTIESSAIIVKLMYNKKVIIISGSVDSTINKVQQMYCLINAGNDNIFVVDGDYDHAALHNYGVEHFTLEQRINKALDAHHLTDGSKEITSLFNNIRFILDNSKWLRVNDFTDCSFIATDLSRNNVKISSDCDGEVVINNLYTGLSVDQWRSEIEKRRSILGDDVILSFVVKGFY